MSSGLRVRAPSPPSGQRPCVKALPLDALPVPVPLDARGNHQSRDLLDGHGDARSDRHILSDRYPRALGSPAVRRRRRGRPRRRPACRRRGPSVWRRLARKCPDDAVRAGRSRDSSGGRTWPHVAHIDFSDLLEGPTDRSRQRSEGLLHRRWGLPLLQQGDVVVAPDHASPAGEARAEKGGGGCWRLFSAAGRAVSRARISLPKEAGLLLPQRAWCCRS